MSQALIYLCVNFMAYLLAIKTNGVYEHEKITSLELGYSFH